MARRRDGPDGVDEDTLAVGAARPGAGILVVAEFLLAVASDARDEAAVIPGLEADREDRLELLALTQVADPVAGDQRSEACPSEGAYVDSVSALRVVDAVVLDGEPAAASRRVEHDRRPAVVQTLADRDPGAGRGGGHVEGRDVEARYTRRVMAGDVVADDSRAAHVDAVDTAALRRR